MDDLKDWEIALLIENISWATKNDWEQTRLIMYSALMPHIKKGKVKNASDILPLSTDEKFSLEKYKSHDYEVSNEQLSRLKQKAEKLEKIFKFR